MLKTSIRFPQERRFVLHLGCTVWIYALYKAIKWLVVLLERSLTE
jgi:hypothetical protein